METIRSASAFGRVHLPQHEVNLLLQWTLGVTGSYLIANDDEPLSADQSRLFRQGVARVAAGEPLPYVTGSAPFYHYRFHVTPDVLIPRPETEGLVEGALAFLRTRTYPRIVDVGTGSGCIAVSLAGALDEWGLAADITAVDLSPAALTIARNNFRRLIQPDGPAAVHFVQGDLLTAFSGPFDLIVANLPYITDEEWGDLPPSVREHEPAMALRGGRHGTDLIDRLLEQARGEIHPDGLILLEIGWRQAARVAATAQSIFSGAAVSCLKDFAGHDRTIEVRLQ